MLEELGGPVSGVLQPTTKAGKLLEPHSEGCVDAWTAEHVNVRL